MSRHKNTSLIALAVFVLVMLFAQLTGCASFKRIFTQPGAVQQIAPSVTNRIAVVQTNILVADIVDNQGAFIRSEVSTNYVTNTVPIILPAIYITNLAVSDAFKSSAQTADTLASAAGIPWSHTATEGVLGAAALVVAWLNQRNSRKAREEADAHGQTRGALKVMEDTAVTLVDNFETIRKVALQIPGYTPQLDHKVMDGVKVAQALAGKEVKSTIHNLVEEKTNDTIAS